MELTPLEQAILLQFVRKYPDIVSADFVANCRVSERDTTSCGFFTTFAPAFPRTSEETGREIERTFLNELKLTASNLTEGADVLLHLTNGKVDFLEVYALGDGHPLGSVQYGFEDMDVNYICF